MPSKVYWIKEPYIMSADYEGKVTEDDLAHVMHECLAEVEKRPIYFLVDMVASTSWPSNILKFLPLNQLIKHPNTKWFVFAGPGAFIKFVIQLSRRDRIKVFDSREAALAFLQEVVANEQEMKKEEQ